MREIEFRGKRIDNGEWIYGDLIQSKNGVVQILPIESDIFFNNEVVDPETVGQFTGLYDKNSKKIFEGDVVKGISKNAVYEVFYSQYLCGFSTKIGLLGLMDCEIIGNVTENPELLK